MDIWKVFSHISKFFITQIFPNCRNTKPEQMRLEQRISHHKMATVMHSSLCDRMMQCNGYH
jgi:hypothetical protein